MTIKLADIFPITDPKDYKVHLACWNGQNQPLDVFVRDRDEWEQWNTWRNTKDEFNRKYIFSLMEFYPERHVWLFGGIYEVLSRSPDDRCHSYTVKLTEQGDEFIGRLKIGLKRPGRIRAVTLDRYLPNMTVSEILQRPYNGEAFCGYENICHTFSSLEVIIRSARPDWRAALKNTKGVYVIGDTSNGKFYVGSAYGDSGIWSRWACYINTGHGWNDELTKLIKENGIGYARENFFISLLEYYPMKIDDRDVIEREGYWKNVFMSRGKFGYNRN